MKNMPSIYLPKKQPARRRVVHGTNRWIYRCLRRDISHFRILSPLADRSVKSKALSKVHRF
jgi:hypothetical protein